ncbi:MAG: hypothetical protein KKC11_02270 [Candidatus Omnitrophica bacterium]|nr:hypothetical protein [Candidatus Omnitrophota bacterium]
MMRRYGWFVILVSLLFIGNNVFSFNLSISDPKINLKVKQDEALTGKIKVANPSSGEIKVKVYLEDFTYIPPYDGTKKFFPSGSTQFSCAQWISFSPQEFKLPPFGARFVNYSLRVPHDAKGSYCAVLFFETALGEIEEEAGYNVKVLGRVGSLIFLEAEGSLKQAKIRNIKTEGDEIKGEFLNLGDVFINSVSSYFVMDEEGMVLDRGKLEDLFLFPKDKAPFTIPLLEKIPAGKFSLICTFDLGAGDILVKELDFIKDAKNFIKIIEIRD